MAQTPEGALKIAAKKAGLTIDEYSAMRAAGLKKCTGCKQWHDVATFNVDATRTDGLSAKGRCCSRVAVRQSRAGKVSAFKGRTHTPEVKAHLSALRKGKPAPMAGRKHTLETRAKISAILRVRAARGDRCPGYIDGKGHERLTLRHTMALKQWRYDVYMRDRFTCQHCGDDRGGNLHAHHIKPFATCPEGRFDVDNGLTLCKPCHKAVHAKKP